MPANAGDTGLIPGLGRFPGEGNGNPLQYSCLGNLTDRGAWRARVHGVSVQSDMTLWLNNNSNILLRVENYRKFTMLIILYYKHEFLTHFQIQESTFYNIFWKGKFYQHHSFSLLWVLICQREK